jgi:hypothetical protein
VPSRTRGRPSLRALRSSRYWSPTAGATFVFFATRTEHLEDPERRFTLTAADIALLNPETRTCPTFRYRRDAELTKTICRTVPSFGSLGDGDWGLKLGTLLHSSADADKFETLDSLVGRGWEQSSGHLRRDGETALPIYEGKMFSLFDHRAATVVMSDAATVRQRQSAATTLSQHEDTTFAAQPYFWVRETDLPPALCWRWIVAFKKVTSPTNERTLIVSVLPDCAANDSVHLLFMEDGARAKAVACLLGNIGSIIVDYLARQKLGGLNFNFFVFRQLPLLPPDLYTAPWIGRRGVRWRNGSSPAS